jgi:glycosidase
LRRIEPFMSLLPTTLSPLWRALGAAGLALMVGACAAPTAKLPAAQPVDPVAQLPADWHKGAFIEIFVRAYRDSNGDGVGDLKGVTQSLDYLQALGVRGIWLMPIQTNADGDHGYATTDYRGIDPAYGTMADFDELVREAARRGIGIIMDYVINHSAAEHPFFVSARSDARSPYRDWYVFTDGPMPEGWWIWDKNPWYRTAPESWNFKGHPKDLPKPPADARGFYFGTFGQHMPDFNMRNPAVVKYHEDALKFWLDRGLAGYRLDATPHLIENNAKDWNDQPESRALTKRFQDLIKAYPRRYVVCEATAKPEEWAADSVCGSSFAFGLQYDIIAAARGGHPPGPNGERTGKTLAEAVKNIADYLPKVSPNMATFLHNHDIFAGRRVTDQLGTDAVGYRLAAATYLLGPGTPFIYYGEEIGMAGTPCPANSKPGDDGKPSCGDTPLRGPMSWTSNPGTAGFTTGTPFRALASNVAAANVNDQLADPNSLLTFYRRLVALRNADAALRNGALDEVHHNAQAIGWVRSAGAKRNLVAVNYANSVTTLTFKPVAADLRLVYSYPNPGGSVRVDAAGTLSVSLPPRSVSLFSTP